MNLAVPPQAIKAPPTDTVKTAAHPSAQTRDAWHEASARAMSTGDAQKKPHGVAARSSDQTRADGKTSNARPTSDAGTPGMKGGTAKKKSGDRRERHHDSAGAAASAVAVAQFLPLTAGARPTPGKLPAAARRVTGADATVRSEAASPSIRSDGLASVRSPQTPVASDAAGDKGARTARPHVQATPSALAGQVAPPIDAHANGPSDQRQGDRTPIRGASPPPVSGHGVAAALAKPDGGAKTQSITVAQPATPQTTIGDQTSGTTSLLASPPEGPGKKQHVENVQSTGGEPSLSTGTGSSYAPLVPGTGSANAGTPTVGNAGAPGTQGTPTPPQATAQVLGAQVQSLYHSGGGQTTVQLSPPSLGSVEVQVQMQPNHSVAVVFVAAQAQTAQMIRSGLPLLAQALQQGHIQLAQTQVTLANPQAGNTQAGTLQTGNFQAGTGTTPGQQGSPQSGGQGGGRGRAWQGGSLASGGREGGSGPQPGTDSAHKVMTYA